MPFLFGSVSPPRLLEYIQFDFHGLDAPGIVRDRAIDEIGDRVNFKWHLQGNF